MSCRECQYFDPFAEYCDLRDKPRKASSRSCRAENTWGASDGVNYYGCEREREDADYDLGI